MLAVCGRPPSAGSARADGPPRATLSDEKKIAHVLSRLGFGARPGDLDRIRIIGVENYIQQQLHPDSIGDDAVLSKLGKLDALRMSSATLVAQYWRDVRRFIDREVAEGRGEELRWRYGLRVLTGAVQPATRPSPPRAIEDRPSLRVVAELQRAKLLRAIHSERQLVEVLVDFWQEHFHLDLRTGLCRALAAAAERDAIRPYVFGRFRDLLGANARSPALLVYLDNAASAVPPGEAPAALRVGADRRANMARLLGADIAMDDLSDEVPSLRETFARTLLSTYTLGEGGGYGPKDVHEVARAFTGWTVDDLTGQFVFDARMHDDGEKVVLGHTLAAGAGLTDGERVLDILAANPDTARNIARKLCQRFIADDPPEPLIERVAQVFMATDGSLRKVVETIISSPAFFAPESVRAKFKSPFEFAVSAVRATGGEYLPGGPASGARARGVIEGAAALGEGGVRLSAQDRGTLAWRVREMGQPILTGPPAADPEDSSRWLSEQALTARSDFAAALTEGAVSDVRLDPAPRLASSDPVALALTLERLARSLLRDDIESSTRDAFVRAALHGAASGSPASTGSLMAIILGSPEFQRR